MVFSVSFCGLHMSWGSNAPNMNKALKKVSIVLLSSLAAGTPLTSTPAASHRSTEIVRSAVKTQRFRVTAYCPCKKCCGPNAKGITASGSKADHPLVAAPKSMAFGTRLRIPGYAIGWEVKIEDRGGAIKEGKLDVMFTDHESALQWGVQFLDVEIEQ